MARIDDINARLAAIGGEIDSAEGEALTALENEVEQLTNERSQIMNDIQARQKLRSAIASGQVTGRAIEPDEEGNGMNNRTFAPDTAEYREAYLMNLQRSSDRVCCHSHPDLEQDFWISE